MNTKAALFSPSPFPAFPTLTISPGHDSGVSSVHGMDLRDYFATRAMVVVFANPDIESELTQHGWRYVATKAYEIADAMLAARVSDA